MRPPDTWPAAPTRSREYGAYALPAAAAAAARSAGQSIATGASLRAPGVMKARKTTRHSQAQGTIFPLSARDPGFSRSRFCNSAVRPRVTGFPAGLHRTSLRASWGVWNGLSLPWPAGASDRVGGPPGTCGTPGAEEVHLESKY